MATGIKYAVNASLKLINPSLMLLAFAVDTNPTTINAKRINRPMEKLFSKFASITYSITYNTVRETPVIKPKFIDDDFIVLLIVVMVLVIVALVSKDTKTLRCLSKISKL